MVRQGKYKLLQHPTLQVYDVKGIDMGNGVVRYKAEIDFDGRELARSYLARCGQWPGAVLVARSYISGQELY